MASKTVISVLKKDFKKHHVLVLLSFLVTLIVILLVTISIDIVHTDRTLEKNILSQDEEFTPSDMQTKLIVTP